MQLFYRTGYIFWYILRLLFGLSIIGFILFKIWNTELFHTTKLYYKILRKLGYGNRSLFVCELNNLIDKYREKK